VVTRMDPFVATLSGDTALRVLFIGGSGVISTAAAKRAVAVGHRLTIPNRGSETLRPAPEDAEVLKTDIRDTASVRTAADSRRAAQHGLRSTDHNTKTPITSATPWFGVVAPAVFGCVVKQPSGLVDGEQGLMLTDVPDQFDSGEDFGDEVGAGPAHH